MNFYVVECLNSETRVFSILFQWKVTKVWFGLENFFSFQSNDIYFLFWQICGGSRNEIMPLNISLSDRSDEWSEWSNELRLSGRGKRNRKREEKEETVKEMGFMLREIRNWSREDSHRFLSPFFSLFIRLIVLMDLSFFFFFLGLAAFVQDRYFLIMITRIQC